MSSGSALVIGAGLAGLSAGITLAQAGWQVTVLESHTRPGGLLQPFTRHGLRCETGFHFITDGGPGGCFRRILAHLGVRNRLDLLPPDPAAQFVLHRTGLEPIIVPCELPQVRASLSARWPGQAAALGRFLDRVEDLLSCSGWLGAVAGLSRALPREADTLGQVLAACGVDGEAAEALRGLAGMLALDVGGDLRYTDYATVVGSALRGSWRLRGGGGALVAALADRLRALGGILHTGRPATRLVWDDRQLTAVEDAAGGQHRPEITVFTAHPTELLRLGGEGIVRPSFATRLNDLPDGPGAVIAYLPSRSAAAVLGPRHHLLQDEAGQRLYAVAPAAFDAGEPALLELLAWVDCGEVAPWADSRIGRRPPAYRAWKQAHIERLLATVQARFPALTVDGPRWACSPLTFRDYTRTRHGAALGYAHNLSGLAGDPIPVRNRLRNLLLTGQNISHPGILGVLIGAVDLAGRIAGRDSERAVAEADGA